MTDTLLTISKNCNRAIEEGNVFQVRLGFKDISNKDKKYVVQLIETVVVENGEAKCVTSEVSRNYDVISPPALAALYINLSFAIFIIHSLPR